MSAATIQMPQKWRLILGRLHGLRGPGIRGTLTVTLPVAADFSTIDRMMREYAPATAALPADEPTWTAARRLAARLVRFVPAVQRRLRMPVFGDGALLPPDPATPSSGRGEPIAVLLPVLHVDVASASLAWAAKAMLDLIAAPSPATDRRTADGFQTLERYVSERRPSSTNTFRFLEAADQLGIATTRMAGSVFLFGEGRNSRLLDSSYTDETSVIGASFAQNKLTTAQLLTRAGLPAPRHVQVADDAAARQAAATLGYPVVVKPANLERGIGVQTDIRGDHELHQALQAARRHSDAILVEKHHDGNAYRLTVFKGRVIKITEHRPGSVTGDGRSTIAELIEREAADPVRRRRAAERNRALLSLDAEATELMERAGMTATSIPMPGEIIRLRHTANVSTGGTSIAIDPDAAHPDNRRLAVLAAETLNLDLAGVDLILQDIAQSWMEIGGVICEVNGQPQIGAGTSPEIYRTLLSEMVPKGGRIPVTVIVGDPPLERCQELARSAGLSSRHGLWRHGERISTAFETAFAAGQALMESRQTDTAVIVMSPHELVQFGLPACHVDRLVLDATLDATADADGTVLADCLAAIAAYTGTADRDDRRSGAAGGNPEGTPMAGSTP